ncbi:MAG: hypothetical protein FWF06_08325, partial [Symbiobacteriaceae bacterium]|nr:hypothetical protein [Symbiobacteriaceae bacterium]
MDWLELAQSIQNGKLSSFYLLAGEDEWQVSQCLASLAQLIPQDIRLHNIMRVAGRNLRPSDLEQYRQTTLFGDEKLLVIEEPRFLRTARQGEESASDKQDNSDESAWQQGLREISQELCLVLVHPGNIDRRRRMSKWLESNATVVNCNPLKRAPMLSIIRSELQRQSLSVEYGVPELIQEIAGEAPGIA